jgi:hypothetical protein
MVLYMLPLRGEDRKPFSLNIKVLLWPMPIGLRGLVADRGISGLLTTL